MFTIGDIKNIAVQIERNGEESYRRASTITKDPEIAEILIWMAEQESKHAGWFANLRSDQPLSAEQKEIEEMGRTLLQDMVKGNDFLLDRNNLESAETVKDIINISKDFEQDTILFYEFLLGFIEDQETCAQLQDIITEERDHINQLEELENANSTAISDLSR